MTLSTENSSTPKPAASLAKKAQADEKQKPAKKSSTPKTKTHSTAAGHAGAPPARAFIETRPGRGGPKRQAAWPATDVKLVPITDLIPYAKNARTHSQSQQLAIARSLEKFGWTNPVLRDEEGVVIAGHGRLLGAAILVARGLEKFKLAPVITAVGWTESEKRAYAIADNQLALAAGWDVKLLESELKEISGMGFQMELMGFTSHELRRYIGTHGAGAGDPDSTPAALDHVVTRSGDLWLLGRHRLICGDATSKQDVSRLYDGRVPALMVSDPPYGVDYDPAWRSDIGGAFARDRCAVGEVSNDDRSDWREAWALFPGAVAYIWHAGKYGSSVEESLKAVGFEMRSQIIWRKPHFAIGRGDYHWQHEPCWYAVRKGGKSNWKGGRKQATVWDIAGLNPAGRGARTESNTATGHSTQKPVECMLRPIENNTGEDEIVYDPFLGSGTTLIAAETSTRICFALELNPAYVDVAVRRWQSFSGQAALLSGRGLSFEEIDTERKQSGRTRTKAKADKAQAAAGQRRAPPAKRTRAAAPA